MEDLGNSKAGALHTIRKALLLTSGLAFLAGGTLAWLSGASRATPDSHLKSTVLPEERNSRDRTSRSLSETLRSGNVDTPGSSGSASEKKSSTRITLNGQDIPLPANGDLHKTVQEGSARTTIDVKVHSSSRTGSGGGNTTQ